MARWWIFIQERFPLGSHLVMIFLFVSAHFAILSQRGILVTPGAGILIFVTMVLFFFKMRLYDEIKDYETDLVVNKGRPLPRGLISVPEVKKAIAICLLLELLLFFFLGTNASMVLIVAMSYSLLMYNEFFIGKWIRPHLTTYAMMHTIVTVPMGLSIFAGASGKLPHQLDVETFYFVFSSWFLFNIFEFGRKTFASVEERNQVESYSKIFGRWGAVLLVCSMAVASIFFMHLSQGHFSFGQSFIFANLVAVAIHYGIQNSPKSAKLYRAFSSLYIVLFYVCFLFEIFFSHKNGAI